MEKYSLYPGKAQDGRPRIHLVEPGSGYGITSTDGLTKTASGEHLPQVIELIESIEAQPGRLYLVNSALGAGEYVGFNLRGDWFTEKGLNHTPPGFEDIPVWDIDARRRAANMTEAVPRWGSLAWGYPTFYNAHRFRHHINKDPNKAYGYILGAFWDDRMKRVILVSELIKTMCAKMGALDLYNRIACGEFPDSSMGSKVPYDRCSICNHHARTPMEYCEHVRKGASPPYGMKSLLPDGRMCGVYNDYPRFFDDSFVFVGAERSAKVMSNVTDQVTGSNAYTQKIYPFMRPIAKIASARGVEDTTPEEMADTAVSAPAPVASAPIPDFVLEEKLTRAIQMIPADTAVERESLRFFMQERLAEERVRAGTMSSTEMQMWKDLSRNVFLRQYGVSPEQMTHLKVMFNSRANQALGITKVAEMPKWAEMLKRIPAPSPRQLSIVRKEEECLPELPREILDEIAEAPGPNLRAAARMGIVARPNEFQYIMMKQRDPALARSLHSRRITFAPRPLTSGSSAFNSRSFVPESVMQSIIPRLLPLLASRSFAPSAIKIRITKIQPVEKIASFREVDGMEDISDLYNQYRLGIMQDPPDLQAVSLPQVFSASIEDDVKTASDSVSLSNLMMNLAYWPGLTLGLHSSAEGTSSEDAATPETNYGEIHHVTP